MKKRKNEKKIKEIYKIITKTSREIKNIQKFSFSNQSKIRFQNKTILYFFKKTINFEIFSKIYIFFY